MLEGINYLHAKFQINNLKNKKVKLLELYDNFGLLKRKKMNKNKELKSFFY